MSDLVAVRLLLVRHHDGCAEQAVADAIALAGPSDPIVDDVGVHGAVLANLPDLDPPILHQDRQGPLHGPPGSSRQRHEGVLADDDRVVRADPRDEDVHELCGLRRLRN